MVDNKKYQFEFFVNGDYEVKLSDGTSKLFFVNKWENEQKINGNWNVGFDIEWGRPESTVFDDLYSWTESSIDGIKYYSGTAVYKKAFFINDNDSKKETKYYLDFGNQQELSNVSINEQEIGTLWMPPFISEITDFTKKGENQISVKVTNLWQNRLIGDQCLLEERRFTKTNIEKFKKDDPLRISGLLRPVRIITSKIMESK